MTIIATVVKSADDDLERLVSSSTMTHVECGGKITAEWEDNKELGKRLVLTCQKCRIKNNLAVNLNGVYFKEENTWLTNVLSGKQACVILKSEDDFKHFCRGIEIWREGGQEEEKIKKAEEKAKGKKWREEEERKSNRNWLIGIAIFIAFIIILWLLLK